MTVSQLTPPASFYHFLLALITILVLARLLGALFARFHQPQVIGEMFAGMCIGPSVLGRIAPDFSAYLVPASITPSLGIVAQIGVVLFMFLVGVRLDTRAIRERPGAAVAISQAGIVVPFLLGLALAVYLYPRYSTSEVRPVVFALFIATSMSVTAFPVLARILTDRGLSRTKLGVIALTCAAVDDVTAWCALAVVVSVAQSTPAAAVRALLLTAGFVAAMLLIVRPIVAWWVNRSRHRQPMSQLDFGLLLIACLASALTTEAIGIHALFGAFIFGAIIPHDSGVARELTTRLSDAVGVLFLPVFFAFTGLRLQVGLVHGASAWMVCGLIIVAATLGKFGGGYVAARIGGLPARGAAAIGVLMNTRGLMELVVLNLGLDLGVLSPALFAMLVIMALVTTFATSPLLSALYRGRGMREAFDQAM